MITLALDLLFGVFFMIITCLALAVFASASQTSINRRVAVYMEQFVNQDSDDE